MPETVYVLTREYDYEGESPLGVFATLEVAQAHGTKWLLDGDYSAEWREGIIHDEWRAGDSPTMIVRREAVRTDLPPEPRP